MTWRDIRPASGIGNPLLGRCVPKVLDDSLGVQPQHLGLTVAPDLEPPLGEERSDARDPIAVLADHPLREVGSPGVGESWQRRARTQPASSIGQLPNRVVAELHHPFRFDASELDLDVHLSAAWVPWCAPQP